MPSVSVVHNHIMQTHTKRRRHTSWIVSRYSAAACRLPKYRLKSNKELALNPSLKERVYFFGYLPVLASPFAMRYYLSCSMTGLAGELRKLTTENFCRLKNFRQLARWRKLNARTFLTRKKKRYAEISRSTYVHTRVQCRLGCIRVVSSPNPTLEEGKGLVHGDI